jgi:nicotinamide-nucleotide amidase
VVDPADVVRALDEAGLTVAVAESLTGGLVSARLADVPGASAVLRGAVVAYATDLKASLLGVAGALLEAVGPVDAEVATQMARGVRDRLGADVGVATTGVAGPEPQGGHPPGTVFVAVAAGQSCRVREEHLDGARPAVRGQAVDIALAMLLDAARAAVVAEGCDR